MRTLVPVPPPTPATPAPSDEPRARGNPVTARPETVKAKTVKPQTARPRTVQAAAAVVAGADADPHRADLPRRRAARGAESAGRSAAAPEHRPYSITELAQEFDVTPRAIRFYEDVGLLCPQRAGRRRVYSTRDRTRLRLTLRGKRLGLSLSEIRQLVEMYDSPSDTAAQLTAFLRVLGEHRRQLEQQREDLEITLAEIAQHEARCRSLLAGARPRAGRSAKA